MATKYLVGIDVGSYSLGCAAIEVDAAGNPIRLLNTVSLIHDSGVDPDSNKSATTRLAASGIARRTRRLYRRRKRRTIKLEKFLHAQGWKTVPFEEYTDPYLPWTARVALVNGFISDSDQRGEYLSIALRHIANHRGWRNPYRSTSSLYSPGKPSDAFNEIREGLSKRIGHPIPSDATVGQLISFAQFGRDRLRGGGKRKGLKNPENAKQAVISARLQQSDHAREINEICRVQKIDDTLRKKIIDLVFAAESPKGAQAGRVGKDPLQPAKDRALKASDSFQRYRVAALLGNLRIRQPDKTQRRLTAEERFLVFDYLINLPANKEPSWLDVAEILSVDRGRLRGTATITDDGERAGARPPVHETNRVIARCKVDPLASWWAAADPDDRAEMVKALSYSAVPDFDSKPGAAVQAFFAALEEDDHQKLDALHLPIGRAAYSEDTLSRLTVRMQSENMDLYEARRAEFGVSEDWTPPKPRIGEPVGNPAVDRVLKGLARWLEAAEAEWGAPQSIVIEHVRKGFTSEKQVRDITRENDRRHKRNMDLYDEMRKNSTSMVWCGDRIYGDTSLFSDKTINARIVAHPSPSPPARWIILCRALGRVQPTYGKTWSLYVIAAILRKRTFLSQHGHKPPPYRGYLSRKHSSGPSSGFPTPAKRNLTLPSSATQCVSGSRGLTSMSPSTHAPSNLWLGWPMRCVDA